MSNATLGEKRDCSACGAKYYDLKKTPPVCPKCGATYQAPKESSRSRKVAAPKVAAKPVKKMAKILPLADAGEEIDLDVFSDAEIDDDVAEDIESIEDIEGDVASISELEDREIVEDRVNGDDADDDMLIDEISGGDVLVDSVSETEEEDEEDE
ncbi:MAG: TIGR02300 family protein [Rickettsiales bacterium]|nr:TIGR02300 family protein [Rickettsiales bacterium]